MKNNKQSKKRGLILLFILPVIGGFLPFIFYFIEKFCFPGCPSFFDIFMWFAFIFSSSAILLPALLFHVQIDGGIYSTIIQAIFNALSFFLMGFFIYKALNNKQKKWIIFAVLMFLFLILGAVYLFLAFAGLGL